MEFHITEDDIASVRPPKHCRFRSRIRRSKISRDGTIAVTTAVTRQALTESNLVPGKLRTALFLPERCKLYGAWSAAISNGKLSLCLPDYQAGKLHLARADRSGTLRCVCRTVEYPHGTAGLHAADHTVAGRGKRCCWDNRSQQAKKKSLRKTEGISGM